MLWVCTREREAFRLCKQGWEAYDEITSYRGENNG